MVARYIVQAAALVCSLLALSGCPPLDEPPRTLASASPSASATAIEPAPLPPEEQPPPDPPAASDTSTRPPPPVEPGITPTGAPTRGTLPKAVIDERVQNVLPAAQACYQRELAKHPSLRGTVSLRFVVAPDGKVAHAEADPADTTLDAAPAVECILNEVRRLEFPAPKGGRVFVSYPLSFEPKPAESR